MTRIKLAYVHEFIDRHGHVRRYFRRPGFKRIPLPGPPGSAGFMAAYQAASEIALAIGARQRSKPGSASAAIAGYYTSLEFRSLASGTQGMRRAILERFRRDHGEKPIALLHSKFIAATLSQMTPHVARSWLKTLRGLLQFCIAQEMVAADVTQGVKPAKGQVWWWLPYLDRAADRPIRGNAPGRQRGASGYRPTALYGPKARRRCAHGSPEYS